MPKNLNFEDDQDFGTGANDGTIENKNLSDELPQIEDDGEQIENKAKDEQKSSGDDKLTTGKYDANLEELATQSISGYANIKDSARNVASLLRNNMSIQQFVTNGNYGRGMVMTTVNIAGSGQAEDKVSHFRIENLKPGRAKSVVVSIPSVLKEVLESTSKKSMRAVREQLLAKAPGGVLTPEQQNDRVSLVMNYDDLMVRVANLCEGSIAEFGGVGGALSVGDVYKYTKKVDPATQTETYEETKLDSTATELINGQNHVMYVMAQPGSALMAKAVKGELLGEKDRKAIKRYKEGKTPLKRTKGAYSALYTPVNFTSTVQYDTVTAFGVITDEQAKALSAKAVFKYNHRGDNPPRLESYDQNMVNGEILRVFDPSVEPGERLKTLQVAEGYIKTKADGTPHMRKVPRTDENGKYVTDANGKRIYDEVPEVAHNKSLSDRLVKDFFTGRPMTDEEAYKAQFVIYGEPGTSKKGTPTSPRVQRKRIAFEGLECEVSPAKGISGTFGLDDQSVTRFVGMVGQEVAKDAFIKAVSRNSKGGENNVVSEYDDGVLAALLEGTN